MVMKVGWICWDNIPIIIKPIKPKSLYTITNIYSNSDWR